MSQPPEQQVPAEGQEWQRSGLSEQLPPEEEIPTERIQRQQMSPEEDTQRLPRQTRQQMPPEARAASESLPEQQVALPQMATQPERHEALPQRDGDVPGNRPKSKRFGWFGGLALALAAGSALLFGVALSAMGNRAMTAEPAATVSATATATQDSSKSSSPSPAKTVQSEPKEPSKTVEAVKVTERQWAKVVKNPDAYSGQRYIIYGQVTQLDSATGANTFRAETAHTVTTEYGFYQGADTVLTGDKKDLSDLVEGDVFRATVTVIGRFDDDTNMAGNKTVPYLTVDKLKVVS